MNSPLIDYQTVRQSYSQAEYACGYGYKHNYILELLENKTLHIQYIITYRYVYEMLDYNLLEVLDLQRKLNVIDVP